MYKPVAALILALFCVLTTTALAAEPADQGRTPLSLAWELHFKHPDVELAVVVPYPQRLGPQVDAAIGAYAKNCFDEAARPGLDYLPERAMETREEISRTGVLPEGVSSGQWYCKYAYTLESPGPGFVSVVFSMEEYTGGAHGSRAVTVLSFDLGADRALTLTDIFKNPARSVAGLLPVIASAVQAQKDPDADPVPADAETLDVNMERLALTPAGLRLYYDPYELGSYAEGSFVVDIPKNVLVSHGANPALWGGQ